MMFPFLKRASFILLALLLPVLIYTQNIFPIPVSYQLQSGNQFFMFKKNVKIVTSEAQLKNEATYLAHDLERSLSQRFDIISTDGNIKTDVIKLELNSKEDTIIGKEGYRLDITPQKIVIKGNTPQGVFYGVQTLKMMIAEAMLKPLLPAQHIALPLVSIVDYPQYKWRGMMLDVSRHFFNKTEVKKFIDHLATYKMNVFHWHLTDDEGWRIDIKSLPLLTQVGSKRVMRYGRFGNRKLPDPNEALDDTGYYTHEDIQDVIAYAAQRHIMVVPEIEGPGHALAAIASYPHLSCTQSKEAFVNPGSKIAQWYDNNTFKMLYDNTFSPAREEVYEFFDKVITEVASLFPSPYIHVGGDECYKGYWKNDTLCQRLMKQNKIRHLEDLQGYFMGRLEKIIQSKGKKMIGWDEILEGGVSQQTAIMSWRGSEHGQIAANEGHDVVMSPVQFAYFDYYQGEKSIEPPIYASLRLKKVYDFRPLSGDVTEAAHILGGQGNVWTEQIHHFRHLEYMLFPRMIALSEVLWSPTQRMDYDQFCKRLEPYTQHLDKTHVNFSRAFYDPIIHVQNTNNQLKITMDTEMPDLTIYYTIDDSMPDEFSPRYTEPLTLPEGDVTLRVMTYKNKKPLGHFITIKNEDLKKRATN